MRITNQQIDDILCTALEGGTSAMWIDGPVAPDHFPEGAKWASDCLTRGADLIIHDDDGGVHRLTLAKFKKGIRWAVEHTSATIDDFDANDADNALQIAIFGELVYG